MNYFEILETLLKSEAAFCDEQGALVKEKVIEEANKYNPRLIELLLGNKETKEEFFVKAADTYIFKIERFMNILKNKAFLPDSYTAFQNKIGFNISKELNSFICLDFPYKDCYLEGGQTKEGKRKEVFFNSILAKDQINKLLEPKVFVNGQRISQKGETKLDGFREESGLIKDNLLIKGNNLLALHSLKKRFAGKVKLIYIDPPYNTGNDSFGYNDSFNHSSWLVFMKNRLEIARELLREDGVIFVQCDDNEQAYLKVLMDEIFGRENFVGDMIRKTKSTTNDAKTGFNMQHENTLIYAKIKANIKLIGSKKSFEHYTNPDNDPRGRWISDNPSAPTGSYFEIINPYTGKIDLPPENCHWRFSESSYKEYIKSGKIKFKKEHKPNERGFIFKRYREEVRSNFNLLNSLELCDNKYMNQVASKERNKLFGETDFSYPKPEASIKVIIESSTQEGDIVLDFFAGSGTTAAVAHKMGRQWITIEQMDYIDTITKERLKKVLEGEQGGISKSINWQGGGDFVYLELASYNQAYIDMLGKAKNTDELLSVYEEIKKNAFVHYLFDFKDFENNRDEFKALSL